MKTKTGRIEVNNIGCDYERYVIARLVDGKLWYWGSWDDEKASERVAGQFDNGVVVDMGEPDSIADEIEALPSLYPNMVESDEQACHEAARRLRGGSR